MQLEEAISHYLSKQIEQAKLEQMKFINISKVFFFKVHKTPLYRETRDSHKLPLNVLFDKYKFYSVFNIVFVRILVSFYYFNLVLITLSIIMIKSFLGL